MDDDSSLDSAQDTPRKRIPTNRYSPVHDRNERGTRKGGNDVVKPTTKRNMAGKWKVSGGHGRGVRGRLSDDDILGGVSSLLLLLFVWPPVGGGFLSLPPWLHGPKGQPPKFSRRENCWEVPKSHYAGVPCVLLSSTGLRYIRIIPDERDTILRVIHTCWHLWFPSVTSLRYIRISTYMLTLVTSEVPRSLSRRKPRRFLRTHSRSIFPRYWTWDVLSYGTMTRRRLYFFGWV